MSIEGGVELKVLEMEGGRRKRQMEDGETRWDQKKKEDGAAPRGLEKPQVARGFIDGQ